MRWVLGICGSLVGLVAVAIVAALIVFQTGWGRRALRSQIESRMNSTFVGGATIGGIEGNPFTDLVLTDVVINGPDKQPAITVRQLTVKVPLLPLISHEVRVEKLIADGLDVNLKRDSSGQLEITHLTYPGPETTWNFTLPDIVVHRGHVALDTGTEVMNFDNLEISVDAKMPFAGPLSASANMTGNWRERTAPLLVAASIRGDKEVFEVKNLAARVGGVSASIVGARIPKGTFSQPFAGTVAVVAPAAAVKQLVPAVELPGDLALAITATPSGRLTYATIDAALGTAHVRGAIRADVQARLANGYLAAGGLDLERLSRGNVPGRGAAFVAFDVDGQSKGELPTARAIVTAWGRVRNAPPTTATIALVSGGDRIHATVGAVGSGIRAGVDADVLEHGRKIVLERGQLVATTQNIAAATMGAAPVHGSLDANLVAAGELSPAPDLTVYGHAHGKNLRMNDMAAQSFALRIDGKHIPGKPIGSARVELAGVRKGDIRFSQLTLAAGNRPDGELQVSLRSRPQPAPWQIDADALVTTGETIVVDLQRHFVRVAGGSEWRGHEGEVRIGPRAVEIENFRSRSGDGHIAVTGSMIRSGRGAGDLNAKVDAALNLKDLAKGYGGTLDAHVEVARTRGRFAGAVTAKASCVSLSPSSPVTLDGDAKIEARADQLLANIHVSTLKDGSAKLALDVEAPKDVTNAVAWKRLTRKAIRTMDLELDNLDVAKLAQLAGQQGLSGHVDGDIKIDATAGGGSIAIRGVKVPQMQGIGVVDADLVIKVPTHDELATTFNARLIPAPGEPTAKDITRGGQARVFADARFAAPERLFDPDAW
ncbi:MAG TPA: hypothetical protein VLB44_09825, partial [Kofleriaceae bacterium]|nr:hypothetical protein [Kofleriaceae bacterium]